MSFIRTRQSELTGFQESAPFDPALDVGVDFVMVYGNDESLYERIRAYKARGYVVHLMTGIAWGTYQDYLYGRWDGLDHWAEAQRRVDGSIVGHGKDIPYMVPTIAFSNYLSEQMKKAIDAGVEAIHMEEPEFWDHSGYSDAFKLQYELFYREPWQAPTTNVSAHYKAAKLKALLYKRILERVADSVKEYSLTQKGKVVRFYVPTHSLINYTQWKIMSPEGLLNSIDSLDGFIAQVWTGTSRSANTYRGVTKERTLETAYCEYSVMQELIKGTGKRMWYLADPIEDNPRYPWSSYQASYLETVTASLLHPEVSRFEVCPWPNRVFNGRYPKPDPDDPNATLGEPIPPRYRTLLQNMFQTLGNMDQPDYHYEHNNDLRLGVALSDTALYQRTYPDPDHDDHGTPMLGELTEKQLAQYSGDEFPMFYGMSLPLLKRGLPLRCVQIDNVTRIPNYLNELKYLVLSYDFMKPASPAVNSELAAWVARGGTLIYVGDNKDPYNDMPAWWNENGKTHATPLEHLLSLLGITGTPAPITPIGQGQFLYVDANPAVFTEDAATEQTYVDLVAQTIDGRGDQWDQTNSLSLVRGPYVVTAVFDETEPGNSVSRTGNFVDLQTPDFDLKERVTTHPGQTSLLYDVDRAPSATTIIGTTARVLAETEDAGKIQMRLQTNAGTQSYLMLKVPHDVTAVSAVDDQGRNLEVHYTLYPAQSLLKINYLGTGSQVELTIQQSEDQ
ncbi:hypothetical protein [Lacticaseibacillus mingshuiensis]|uniref:hypothetical protein n=1 Tax=Lacticaseibacillus mingshuiensis TaxID=2799574 RepID=UPI001941116A|nr:hypothetical protein [Lacticaseibacillus mingshuiensis]